MFDEDKGARIVREYVIALARLMHVSPEVLQRATFEFDANMKYSEKLIEYAAKDIAKDMRSLRIWTPKAATKARKPARSQRIKH